MRVVIITAFLLICSIIQTSVIGYTKLFGVTPNLFIVIITGFALLNGPVSGAAIGFAAGLCWDIVLGSSIGGFSLLGMYLGMIVGILNKRFVKDSLLVAVPFVLLATLAYESVFYFFSLYLRGHTNIIFAFKNIILPESLYNSAVTIIFFPIILIVNRWMEEHRKNQRKY